MDPMKPNASKRPKRIFWLFLVPLLLLVVLQAAMSFGTVMLGGTFSTLQNFSINHLTQATETRRVYLENEMEDHWSSFSEELESASHMLEDVLGRHSATLQKFLSDDLLKEEYLRGMLRPLRYMMSKNGTSGAFIILADEGVEGAGGSLSSLYIRSSAPGKESGKDSGAGITLAAGPADLAKESNIPFDPSWSPSIEVLPSGERDADLFFFAPYEAAGDSGASGAEDLKYWSAPFSLGGDGGESYGMVTCSIPLISPDGEAYGVMGVELSLSYLRQNLPPQEVSDERQGGYLLLRHEGGEDYGIVCSSGAYPSHAVSGLERVSLRPTKYDGLLLLDAGDDSSHAYVAVQGLGTSGTGAPYGEHEWYVAGVESYQALFGPGSALFSLFLLATLLSLAAAIVASYLLARYVTKPIQQLSDCISLGGENDLDRYERGRIREVDELYDTIRRLDESQKQSEYALRQEKERYRLALQNNTDVLVTYDLPSDCATFYNLNGDGGEMQVHHFLYRIEMGNYIHPEDRDVMLARLQNVKGELTTSFRSNWLVPSGEFEWYELNGRMILDADGKPSTFIGSMHNIHSQMMREMEERESLHRDPLTGLYRASSGEEVIRSSIRRGHDGCLLLLDVNGFLSINDRFGMVVGDAILEEIGQMMLAWKEENAPHKSTFLRLGGDEFMVWLEDFDSDGARAAAEEFLRRTEQLYADGSVAIRLSCGGAMSHAQPYEEVLSHACAALACAEENDVVCIVDRAVPQVPSGDSIRITPIEHTSAGASGIVPLTFSFFDRSSDIGGILTVLFPKLGRAFGADDILLVQVSREFSTSRAIYQWHRDPAAPRDHSLERFSPDRFQSLEESIWGDRVASLDVDSLNAEQRHFLRVPPGRSGTACALYDNGNYMGCLLLLFESEKPALSEERKSELHEIAKIIEANMNRQRYDAANRAKSDFLSRMSHEIRTPMNAIIGMTYIAQSNRNDPEKLQENLEKISQSSQYLLSLINDILDMSRIESGKLTIERADFDLSALLSGVEDLVRPQAEEKDISLTLDATIKSRFVVGDSLHLNQVLVNLLGNAVKFTPSGGSVTLSAKQGEDGSVRFSVRDTGIGVSPENQSRIFESFEQAEGSTTRKYGGSGLGLAISSRLVRMMGGIIELDSELGKGSDFHFTITLPLGEAPRDEEEGEKAAEEISAAGLRILLVEDNELNIEIAQTILEMQSAIVTLARNGQEAVDVFLSAPAGSFDLILMDIQMPVMDGLEATRVIRQSDHPDAADIPIIAMTANAFDEDTKKSVESGMNGHLSKPLDMNHFFQTIREVLGDRAKAKKN